MKKQTRQKKIFIINNNIEIGPIQCLTQTIWGINIKDTIKHSSSDSFRVSIFGVWYSVSEHIFDIFWYSCILLYEWNVKLFACYAKLAEFAVRANKFRGPLNMVTFVFKMRKRHFLSFDRDDFETDWMQCNIMLKIRNLFRTHSNISPVFFERCSKIRNRKIYSLVDFQFNQIKISILEKSMNSSDKFWIRTFSNTKILHRCFWITKCLLFHGNNIQQHIYNLNEGCRRSQSLHYKADGLCS